MKRLCLLLLCTAWGCDSSFQQIDRRVDLFMFETSGGMGATPPSNRVDEMGVAEGSLIEPSPATINPGTDTLIFLPADELDIEAVAALLDRAAEDIAASGHVLTLQEALSQANQYAREMAFAEYDYLSSTLSLLGELHLWGPRFFNTINTAITSTSFDGLYNTSLTVVNDFSVTKRLPYGGSISAGALTSFARSLHTTSTSSDSASTTFDVAVSIPLLRGSGAIAQESLIQANRNLVYAARNYERFRRSFFRNIVGDFLSLVVQKQSLDNAQRGVDALRQLAIRQDALYRSGRTRLYDSADAENQALASVARLSQSWERYRLALDRFKIRIGWPINDLLQVEATTLGVVPPAINMSDAVRDALLYRLDLQNERDRVTDSHRGVENTINALLPDITLSASASLDSELNKAGVFNDRDVDYLAGLAVSLPLDRETERIAVRQQQISLERARRNFRESRDRVAVEVRSALRNIEVFQFSLNLQERNVEIAQLGLDSINADPDRVSVLDQTRAISELQSAQDARDSAKRDLELSIIDYLLQAGQLRINSNGGLLLPPGNST